MCLSIQIRCSDLQDEDQVGLEGAMAPDAVWEGVGTVTWGSGADFRE